MNLARDGLARARVRQPQNVVHRTFPSETVVLNLETGTYHGLNPTAGRMLEELDRAESVRAAAMKLAAEFDQPLERVESDIFDLCSGLVERGLLVVEPAQESGP